MQFYKAWEVFCPYLRLVLTLLSGDATQNGPCLVRVLSQLNDGDLVARIEEPGVGCQAFELAEESLSVLSGKMGLQRNDLIDSTTVVAVVAAAGTNPIRSLLGEHPPEPRGPGYVAEYSLEKIDSSVGSTVRISNPVVNDAEVDACVEVGRLDLLGSGKTHQIA